MKSVMLVITNLTGGGAERVVSIWSSELAEEGYKVSLLLNGRVDHEYPLSDKVIVKTISPTYKEYKRLSRFAQFRIRRRIIKECRPDYLISFLPHIQVWTLLSTIGLNVKKIETLRVDPFHGDIHNKPKGSFLWRKTFDLAESIIVQSSGQMDFFNERNKRKCTIIPNPISDVYYNHYKKEFSDTCSSFIAVGRIMPQKNYKMMIKAVADAHVKNPNINLKIYGDDEAGFRLELQKMINDLNASTYIHFMGRTDNMPKVYGCADCFLMSSNFEGMPNSLAEAMASKLICISTDCRTGPSDLIDDQENGYLIPVGNTALMTSAILNVMTMSKTLRESIGNKARNKVFTLCSKENSLLKLKELLR